MKIKVFKERLLSVIREDVESFLNMLQGCQIIDISWIHADSYWHCIITYFVVE